MVKGVECVGVWSCMFLHVGTVGEVVAVLSGWSAELDECVAEDGDPLAEDVPWQLGFDPVNELTVCDHYRGW